jgi:predicted AAA+ superfamily ATPase
MIIKREILKILLSDIKKPHISIIIGARQTGKTTLLKEIEKVVDIKSVYLNLENPFHLELFNDGYKSLIREIGNEEAVLFIDEFQYYKNITSIFKVFYDIHPEIKIYASGSSSLEIHKHLKESLAGRLRKTSLYPFSFSEWISQYLIKLPSGLYDELHFESRENMDAHLNRFLLYGALPGLIHTENDIDKREYLEGIFQTYIQKDIKAFLKEESIIDFNKLIRLLAISTGRQLNLNKLAGDTGIGIRQIKKQIDILASTFVIHLLPPYFNNRRKEIIKMPKVYFYDTGMVNAIKRDFRPVEGREDKGALFETYVFHEIKKSMDVSHDLFYWRTADQHEVDFILVKDQNAIPVEVKLKGEKGKIPKGLKHFLKTYSETKEAVILCDKFYEPISFEGVKIHFMPYYQAGNLVQFFM